MTDGNSETAVTDDSNSAEIEGAFKVQMLGGSGVGKTCFIAGLAVCHEQLLDGYHVIPRDSASKRKFETLRRTLKAGVWPEKTSMSDDLSLTLERRGDTVEVSLKDFAGESFMDQIHRGEESEAASEVKDMIAAADLLLILLDGSLIDQGDSFDGSPMIQAVFECLNSEKQEIPDVLIGLTKSDLVTTQPVDTENHIKELVAARCPRILSFLEDRNVPARFAGFSACGPQGTGSDGSPIFSTMVPQGYQSLFDLAFERRDRPAKQFQKAIGVSCVLAVLLLAGLAFGYQQWTSGEIQKERQAIQGADGSAKDLPEVVSSENEAVLRTKYFSDLEDQEELVQAADSVADLEVIANRVNSVPEGHKQVIGDLIEDFETSIKERKEQIRYQQVADKKQGDLQPFELACTEYLDNHPAGLHAEEVRELRDQRRKLEFKKARQAVARIPVNSRATLVRKVEAATNFLETHRARLPETERQQLELAVRWGKTFLEPTNYNITLVRTEGLDTPRDHGVLIEHDGIKIQDFNDSGDVIEKDWKGKRFSIIWQAGQPITATLWDYDAFDSEMADFKGNTPLEILLLTGKKRPNNYSTDEFAQSYKKFRITFKCSELTATPLEAIEQYIYPGTAWEQSDE